MSPLLASILYDLAGLRYAPEIAGKLLEKVAAQMKESMTYQKILADGREEGIAQGVVQGVAVGERRLFLKIASRRLGEPDAATLARVELASALTIEKWAEALDQVETWSELVKA